MRFRRLRLAVAGRVLLGLLLTLGLVLAVSNGFQAILFYVPYAAVGTLLVLRRPANVIGWLLLALSALDAVSLNVPGTAGPLASGTAPFAERVFGWLTAVVGPPIFFCYFLLAVVFPTGRLPRGRWGVVVRGLIVLNVALVIAVAIGPTVSVNLSDGSAIDAANPFALVPALAWWTAFGNGIFIVLIACDAVAVIAMVVRLRRAEGLERLQLRWVVASLVLVCSLVVFAILTTQWLPAVLAFPSVPIAIGIAVLRYRLYEIDVLVNRTAVYGTVTLLLVGFFFAANIALQRLVESLTGQRSDLLAATLGAGAAVAFTPLRRLVRPLVDRVLPGRAMLTLLFTDIVGSTQAVVELGDDRWRGLLSRYLGAVRQELSRHRGHEVNTAGDAFFATFERPIDGLRCAWAIRASVRQLGLETRTGLHLGECEMRGEQVSGLAVHTAARVMAAAGQGEILVSDAMRDALAEVDFALVDRGRHELRGVPGEWQLYAAEPAAGVAV
jgi:class 3 adenylate cyclase